MCFQSEINAVIQREVESRTDRNSEVINRQAAILFELRGKLETIEGERDALQQKLDAVVAEGITLRKFIRDSCYVYNGDGGDISDAYGLAEESTLFPRQVETIVYLNAVRADAIFSALKECTFHCDADCVMDAYGFSYEDAEMRSAGAVDLRNEISSFAAQLRADAAKDGV